MLDRTVTRIGAGAAMLGAVIAIVFNILYPRADDPGSVSEFVALSTSEGGWAFTHYMLGWAIALTFLGLIVVARSFVREPSASWARVGLWFAVGGALVLFLSIVLLGFALKSAAEMADAATAEGVGYVGGGMFVAATGLFFGLVPLLFGVAILTGDEFPSWLGYVAVLAGIVGLVAGTIMFFDGFSDLTDMVLFPIASLLFTAWIGIMGYTLWQRTSSPAGASSA